MWSSPNKFTLIMKGLVVTSSERVVRKARRAGGGGESSEETVKKTTPKSKFGQQRTMRRVQMHDIDRSLLDTL
jgi:hypothetical protein